ncbi:MAG: lysophospholipid acyltransferase family protein [Alphaproteobacteria bacterium]|nr:lysophospholipid acyltransferase family protein [Alphaproteobacteria bacterium]
MNLPRAIAFQLAFWIWSALINLAWLPSLLMSPLATVRGQTIWAKGVMMLLGVLVGIRYEIRGRNNIPAGPVLIAAKHQSAWDTMIFHIIANDPAVVMKAELLKIPIYGWYCRHSRMIPIDRDTGSKAIRAMVDAAKAAAAEARPIIIFPQGTRVAPGVEAPYLPGIAALYRQLGIPVVPVALNSGVFWSRQSIRRKPGTIVLEYLPVIEPGLNRKDFMARLEAAIEPASTRLAETARQT